MRSFRASPFQLARHEFYRSIRISNISAEDVFRDLTVRKMDKLQQVAKLATPAVLLALILNVTESNLQVEIQTSFVTIAVPKLYLHFLLSLITGILVLEIMGYFVLNDYQAVVAHKMLRVQNTSVRAAIYDGGPAWSFPLSLQYRFFNGGWTFIALIATSMGIALSPYALIVSIIYIINIRFHWQYLDGYGYLPFGDAIAFASLLILIGPVFVSLFYFMRFEMRKNYLYIRWDFLSPIYRREAKSHPRIRFWS